MKLLSTLNISLIEGFRFERMNDFTISAFAGTKTVFIDCKQVINMTLSLDPADPDRDEIDVVEVEHEYRRLRPKDLVGCQFRIDTANTFGEFHIISFHGSSIVTVICEDLAIR